MQPQYRDSVGRLDENFAAGLAIDQRRQQLDLQQAGAEERRLIRQAAVLQLQQDLLAKQAKKGFDQADVETALSPDATNEALSGAAARMSAVDMTSAMRLLEMGASIRKSAATESQKIADQNFLNALTQNDPGLALPQGIDRDTALELYKERGRNRRDVTGPPKAATATATTPTGFMSVEEMEEAAITHGKADFKVPTKPMRTSVFMAALQNHGKNPYDGKEAKLFDDLYGQIAVLTGIDAKDKNLVGAAEAWANAATDARRWVIEEGITQDAAARRAKAAITVERKRGIGKDRVVYNPPPPTGQGAPAPAAASAAPPTQAQDQDAAVLREAGLPDTPENRALLARTRAKRGR